MKKLLRLPSQPKSMQESPIESNKVIQGTPIQAIANLYTNSKENFFCGVWQSDTGKWNLQYSEDEFCYIIEGQALITDSSGHSETVNAGDAFVMPAGFIGTWETIEFVKKFYSIYEEEQKDKK